MTHKELVNCRGGDLLVFKSSGIRTFVTYYRESIDRLVWVEHSNLMFNLKDKISQTINSRARYNRSFVNHTFRAAARELSLPTTVDKLEAKLLGII